MKKSILFVCALVLGATAVSAQEKERQTPPSHAGRVYISLQGGPAINIYENYFSYRENGQMAKLLTPQGALAVGYDFSDTFGLRLQGAFGTDAGACNTRNTATRGFYPYSFKHANAFVDACLNLAGLMDKVTAFRPKVYLGAGGAYTFGFQETGTPHPWQWNNVTKSNLVFGFRGGFIAEYTLKSGLGFLLDFCAEAYTDKYNGLKPSENDQFDYEGYGGFPYDVRGLASLGIVYHF